MPGRTFRGSSIRGSSFDVAVADGEMYVLAKGEGRRAKEMAMRRKKLARLLWKLRVVRRSCPSSDPVLLRIGAGHAPGFVKISLLTPRESVIRESFLLRSNRWARIRRRSRAGRANRVYAQDVRGFLLAMIASASALAESPCAGCHPKEEAAYRRSPMGRSLMPVKTRGKASFTRAGMDMTVDGARHEIRKGQLSAQHTAAWQIGSGSHAAGFLTSISGALYQSPFAYYSGKELWDVAPGYEALPQIDFNRRVTPECLGCHASGPPGSPRAIDCDRCHGEGNAHAIRPSKTNIVNPSKLAPIERVGVCEQCHLTGVARIPQPGAAPFAPGGRLEDSLAIFVQSTKDLKVVSHVEQLALAKCGPNLVCATCHNPHGETVNIDSKCTACHTVQRAGHAPSGCAQCHMPKRGAADGLHTAFTDHRIAKPNQFHRVDSVLRAWRSAPNADRNEGLARFATGDMQGAFRQLTAAYARHPKDPELLASLGFILFLKDQQADAVKLIEAAISERREHAPYYQKLAIVQRARGDGARAAAALESAIRFDPLDETNYHLLAELQPAKRREILGRYLRIHPQHFATREALARP